LQTSLLKCKSLCQLLWQAVGMCVRWWVHVVGVRVRPWWAMGVRAVYLMLRPRKVRTPDRKDHGRHFM
jgi:hypothetical protein